MIEAADRLERRLNVSRDQLYAEAIRCFVAEHSGRGVTELLNGTYRNATAESELDSVLDELQSRTFEAKD